MTGKICRYWVRPIATAFLGVGMWSCFTGIESTPKITQRDVQLRHITDSPEHHLLDSVRVARPSEWQVGKTFHISDDRAGRAMWRVAPPDSAGMLGGRTARLLAVDTVGNLTGDIEIELAFGLTDNSVSMLYRPGITLDDWRDRTTLTIPYFVDLDLVDMVADKLVGKTYYILQARRHTATGADTVGRRYDPVLITAVEPGNDVQPLLVKFTDPEGRPGSIRMTLGDEATSRRNFETLFALENPRLRYKSISDDHWNLICNSRVTIGMTPEECRLALGPPDNYRRIPTTAGIAEQWFFTNGTYLLFEDGTLSHFR